MKKILNIVIVPAFAFALTGCGEKTGTETSENNTAKDSTGLPGDHFSLEGALELFKNASSPEDFEKQLNTQSNNVNNLDLNGDNKIDYIRVIDNMQDDAHALVLQAALGKDDAQDIAVIEIEKTSDDSAVLQIVGDEALYADSNIVEPLAQNNVNTRNTASFG